MGPSPSSPRVGSKVNNNNKSKRLSLTKKTIEEVVEEETPIQLKVTTAGGHGIGFLIKIF